MNDLIKVSYENDRPTVSGRELHQFLEVETDYPHWFARMTEYGFTEGIDHQTILTDGAGFGKAATRTDHQLTIDMAKELCMIQRTEKGKQARQYFIELEKRWNDPMTVMSRALKLADGQIKQLQIVNSTLTVENAIMAPKAEYFDQLVDRGSLLSIRDTAKELRIKEREFVSFLIDHGYIYRDKKGKIQPYAQHNDNLFEIKESMNDKTGWTGTQTLITLKGRETFRRMCLDV